MSATSSQSPVLTTEIVVAAERLDAAGACMLRRVDAAGLVVLPVLGVALVRWRAAVASSRTRADWGITLGAHEPVGSDANAVGILVTLPERGSPLLASDRS
jgi:hypothetical protein